ncbi:MAG TPA: hypothetical protein VLD86_14620 [Ilumatobacteraceae bacterium]|nr:hypothetical protein [Ilumatobacteraceae bacterium]
MRGEQSPEVIELLELLDTDAFGDGASSHTPRDGGGSRWIAPAAGLALAAIIAYGVATSSSSQGAPEVASPPSTAPKSTPTAAPTSTPTGAPAENVAAEAAFPVPYYAAEPPRGYKVQEVGIQLADSGAYYGADGYQLWATNGAAATEGAWFSIQSFRGGTDFHITDAYRVNNERQPIAISHTAGGQSVAQLAVGRMASVTVTSFGRSDDELVRLAESITYEDGRAQVGDQSLLDGYRLTSTVMPWLAIQGVPVERTYYAPVDDLSAGVRIAVGLPAIVNDGDIAVDRQTALRFFLIRRTAFTVGGHPAVAGEVVGRRGFSVASWSVDNHIVTLSGLVSVPQIVAIARTVHEVSTDEWEGMKLQASLHRAEVDRLYTLEGQTQPTPVSSGIDENGKEWAIQAAVASFGDEHQITWMWNEQGGTSWTSLRDDTAQINPVVGVDRTYVLADLPRAIAAQAELHITRPGTEAVVVPFTDIDPNLDRTLAAYVFSEPGPYDAQVVGPDGAVLASWPLS